LTDRINSPGTVGPHNWSFRLAPEQEEIALREMEKMKPLLAAAGRC
jgi:4-alpha-glucanotransferase